MIRHEYNREIFLLAKVHVPVAISTNYRSDLVVVNGNLTSQDILSHMLVHQRPRRRFTFKHDNVLPCTTRMTRDFTSGRMF